MHSFSSLSLLSLIVLRHLVICVRAQTTLFIPGFDPQPLSAGVLGTDGQGRTTWEIVPGTPTDSFGEVPFIGTATLVEGPNDAHLIYNNALASMSIDIQCGISNGIAACTGIAGYPVTPFIFPTEPAEGFLVQGGGPLTATPSQTASPTASTSTSSPTSSSNNSATNPSAASSNDARSKVVVQVPLFVIVFAVMSLVV